MMKTAILGAAAGLMACGAAQAADLPVKAKPVEYVRVCSLYGAGFFYIPGTDTCIKLGGYLRIDTSFNGTFFNGPNWFGDVGQRNRYADYFSGRSRLSLLVDTRTATEYGVVRTYGQADFQFSTFGLNTTNPAALNLAPPASLLDTPGGGYVSLSNVFMQFAGFTFGKSASAYATPWHGFLGNNTSFLLGGHDSITGVNNIQYSAQFGGGISATIGLDDPTVYNRTSVYNLAEPTAPNGLAGNAYAGVRRPDIVGNVRVDQAWGLLQVSAAAHEVSGSYNILAGAAPTTLSEISGHPDSKWGGAVMTALQLKNLPTGPGDDLKLDATYAVGDTKQVISGTVTSPSFVMLGGSDIAYKSIGIGATTDAVFRPVAVGGTGDLKLTRAWGVRGAFNHNWNPQWSTSLFGSWSSVRYDGNALDQTTAKGQYCAAFAVTHPGQNATYTCNPDFNVAMLGIVTRWNPIKNMALSAEVLWSRLDQKMAGTSVFSPAAPQPVARFEFRNQDTVSLNVRAQRNF